MPTTTKKPESEKPAINAKSRKATQSYESLRPVIQKAVRDASVRVSRSGTETFRRNPGACYEAVEKLLQAPAKSLPEQVKQITLFELDRLEKAFLSNEGWEHTGTSVVNRWSADLGCHRRKTDRFLSENVTVDQRLDAISREEKRVLDAMATETDDRKRARLDRRWRLLKVDRQAAEEDKAEMEAAAASIRKPKGKRKSKPTEPTPESPAAPESDSETK